MASAAVLKGAESLNTDYKDEVIVTLTVGSVVCGSSTAGKL